MFRDKFWLSFALTIPVVLWSADVQHWLGYTAPSFPGSSFIPSVLGTLVFRPLTTKRRRVEVKAKEP
jgi:Cu2+-exporting ATPase